MLIKLLLGDVIEVDKMGAVCGTNGGEIIVYIILMGKHQDIGLLKTQEQISGNMKTDVKIDVLTFNGLICLRIGSSDWL